MEARSELLKRLRALANCLPALFVEQTTVRDLLEDVNRHVAVAIDGLALDRVNDLCVAAPAVFPDLHDG